SRPRRRRRPLDVRRAPPVHLGPRGRPAASGDVPRAAAHRLREQDARSLRPRRAAPSQDDDGGGASALPARHAVHPGLLAPRRRAPQRAPRRRPGACPLGGPLLVHAVGPAPGADGRPAPCRGRAPPVHRRRRGLRPPPPRARRRRRQGGTGRPDVAAARRAAGRAVCRGRGSSRAHLVDRRPPGDHRPADAAAPGDARLRAGCQEPRGPRQPPAAGAGRRRDVGRVRSRRGHDPPRRAALRSVALVARGEADVRPGWRRAGPPGHHAGAGRHRGRHQAREPRPRALPSDQGRTRRRALPHLQVPHDVRGRRGPQGGARRAERVRGRPVQDRFRSARHAGRASASQDVARRAAAAVQRHGGLDEPRRPSAAHPRRGRADHRLRPGPAPAHPGHDRSLADPRVGAGAAARDGEDRLPLRRRMVAVERPQDPPAHRAVHAVAARHV
ncbi:MAG: Undecaprenyl-phosphate galactosephosphotransferase, partial [uncultured Solirubrobacteraceae bacterium]